MASLFTNTYEKPHSDQGVNSGYDFVFGSVRELHCTWLVSRTRASSDAVDVLDSREWIHLKKGVDRRGCGPIVGFGHLVESQEGLETEVGPRANLVGAPRVCSMF
ncbi:hypothetical protein M9H77_13365 [Catharanthus roseus]|uniref:Uncharacterized protein n=1 Tax=Catharanthus roseus TaxID=4058 RepID=A0ACC0BK82_CATRO|nr:hypothetical protein M9H77_13365 [Catharanthus roseus]